ncbi:hypothetical protein MATL_G00071230 [Megalops atlanticus]|uniref:Uncharacterized protein n=1 Tax=Megalops atlanticus TaxID=7932 RepID=A0A9D3TBZ2_MEGAT|nr:hypothetical protein MATL_G00071230 [Megalops atlanticus]
MVSGTRKSREVYRARLRRQSALAAEQRITHSARTNGGIGQERVVAGLYAESFGVQFATRTYSTGQDYNVRKHICMNGGHEYTVWSGKPDTYGWGIYPKMYERKKLSNISNGMGGWRASRSFRSAGRRAGWRPLWISWTLRVPRRLTTPSTRWGTETCAPITMSRARSPAPRGAWTIPCP